VTLISSKSNCDGAILSNPDAKELIGGKGPEFCVRCECKYENRNTTIIKVRNSYLNQKLLDEGMILVARLITCFQNTIGMLFYKK